MRGQSYKKFFTYATRTCIFLRIVPKNLRKVPFLGIIINLP